MDQSACFNFTKNDKIEFSFKVLKEIYMYGYGHERMQRNEQRLKLINDIDKIQKDTNSTLETDTAIMETRLNWVRRVGYVLIPINALRWICEKGHNISERFEDTHERLKSGESYLCLQCSNTCIKCKNDFVRTNFSKNRKHTSFNKTCTACRDNMKNK